MTQKLDYSKKTAAPMVCLQFIIDEGDYNGRHVPPFDNAWYRVMVGGKTEEGSDHNLGRWFDTINALKAEWTCTGCGTASTRKFVREKGKLFCPQCGGESIKVGVDCDSDQFVGLRCRIIVDQRTVEGFDEPINDIAGLRPLE
jgi:hypothetical protein